MAKISKTFTYNIADDYLAQTNDLGKTNSWTYDGHDKIYAFFYKENGKYAGRFLTPDDNGADYPTPLDQYKFEIDATENPLLCCILGADEVRDYTFLPQYEEELPCGGVYIRPLAPPPDHTYELSELVYDPDLNDVVKPYPWKKPHVTWTDIRTHRNQLLLSSDNAITDDMPAATKAKWEEYRQKLRDIPQTYGAEPGAEPTVDPWKIKPVLAPDEK